MPMTLSRNVLKIYKALKIKQFLMKYNFFFFFFYIKYFKMLKKEAKGHTTISYAVKNWYVPGKHKHRSYDHPIPHTQK